MTHQERLKNQILRLAAQSASAEVRDRLTSFLTKIKKADGSGIASEVAGTLLSNLRRFRRTNCSDKQAYVIARCAYENCLDLDRDGNCFDYFTPYYGNL